MAQIFTIGYGSSRQEVFVSMLCSSRVEFLLDVRTKPYSRFRPEFGRERLKAFLAKRSIRYAFLGEQLGGLPSDVTCYTNGHVDYKKYAKNTTFRHGIERLLSAAQQGFRVALMCSEGKPWECHRAKLIGVELQKRGIDVGHFLPDGKIYTQEQVIAKLTDGQGELFETAFRSRRAYL